MDKLPIEPKYLKLIDSLKKGSFVYFVNPDNILKHSTGYVQKRVTKCKSGIRTTDIYITKHYKSDPNDKVYIAHYFKLKEKPLLGTIDGFCALDRGSGESSNKTIYILHNVAWEFYRLWLVHLRDEMKTVDLSTENLSYCVDKVREVLETMRFCTQMMQGCDEFKMKNRNVSKVL